MPTVFFSYYLDYQSSAEEFERQIFRDVTPRALAEESARSWTLHRIRSSAALGGPALFLLGESMFRLRMIGSVAPRRLACVAALAATTLVSGRAPALALIAIGTAMLVTLALSEQYAPGPLPARPATTRHD